MEEYLRDSKSDKIYNNAMTIIVSILSIVAIFFIGLGITSEEYLFSVLVVVVFAIVLLPFWFIDKKRRKKVANRQKYYIIKLEHSINYSDIIKILDEINKKRVRYDYTEYASVFSFKKTIKYRVMVVHQDYFNIDNYKKTKKKANHLYNEKYDISHSVSPREAGGMFDLNIICCDNENSELYTHMSKDAELHLRMVVGMLDIAIVGNKLIIPSIRDNCDPPGINHYIRVNKALFRILGAIQE